MIEPDKKQCTGPNGCHEWFDISEFPLISLDRRRNNCRECHNKLQKVYRDRAKAKADKKRESCSGKNNVTVYGDAAKAMFSGRLV